MLTGLILVGSLDAVGCGGRGTAAGCDGVGATDEDEDDVVDTLVDLGGVGVETGADSFVRFL
jgi:hypothetical protein